MTGTTVRSIMYVCPNGCKCWDELEKGEWCSNCGSRGFPRGEDMKIQGANPDIRFCSDCELRYSVSEFGEVCPSCRNRGIKQVVIKK